MPENKTFEKTYRDYPFAALVSLGLAAGEIFGRWRRSSPNGPKRALRIRRWLAQLRLHGFLGQYDTARVARILAAAGMRRSELFARSGFNPGRRRQMAEMMRCFRVDVEFAGRHHWAALCVAERACARCPDKAECRAWLDGAGDHDAPRAFCPNAGIFDRMAKASRAGHTALDLAA